MRREIVQAAFVIFPLAKDGKPPGLASSIKNQGPGELSGTLFKARQRPFRF